MRAWLRGLHSRSLIGEIEPAGWYVGDDSGMVAGEWGAGFWSSAGRFYDLNTGSDYGRGTGSSTGGNTGLVFHRYDEPGNRRR